MADATKEGPADLEARIKRDQDEKRNLRKGYRAELKALQDRGTIFVVPNTSARLASQLNPTERALLAAQGRTPPPPLSAAEQYRLWQLHYLIAGVPIPVRDDLDD